METVNFWTLRIEHDFYQNGEASDFDMRISSEMLNLLMRRNIMWRRRSVNEWCLCSFGNLEVDDEDVLELELVAQGHELQYVTDFVWPIDRDCYEVQIPVVSDTIAAKKCMDGKGVTGTPFGVMKLSIPFGEIIHSRAVQINTTLLFHAVCKYWEYIFIPRQQQQSIIIRLEDTKKVVNFKEVEPMDFMGRDAYRVRSLEKIPLRSFYENIDLVLWEAFSSSKNKRLLLRNLPFPQPTLNLGLAPDTVWRILYY